jgi:hypothetical protein
MSSPRKKKGRGIPPPIKIAVTAFQAGLSGLRGVISTPLLGVAPEST